MAQEMRFTLNHRINSDMNVSVSFVSLIDDTEEARDAGKNAFDLWTAFIEGFTGRSVND